MLSENNIGYFGVIVPKHHFWEGFFLNSNFEPEAREFLNAFGATTAGMYMPPAAVIKDIESLPNVDQAWIGALSAGIVDRAVKRDFDRLGPIAMALHLLTGMKYFIITADIDPRGTHTKIINMKDAGHDAVVRALNSDPDVIRSKIALTKWAKQNIGKKPN